MIAVPMQVAVSDVLIPVTVSANNVGIQMNLSASYQMVAGETYQGTYEFTPTTVTQMVHTADKVLLEDIVINPIPQNYGLITWDGSVLTVS